MRLTISLWSILSRARSAWLVPPAYMALKIKQYEWWTPFFYHQTKMIRNHTWRIGVRPVLQLQCVGNGMYPTRNTNMIQPNTKRKENLYMAIRTQKISSWSKKNKTNGVHFRAIHLYKWSIIQGESIRHIRLNVFLSFSLHSIYSSKYD